MFEAGRLVMRVALDGAQTIGRDLSQLRNEFGKLDNDGRRASEEVGRGLLGVGATITGLAAVAVAKFASFDKAFSQVRANVQGSPADFAALQKAAIEAGQTSVYTAEEAAGAQAELAKAGVDTASIMGGGLTGSLALAAAGQIDVAEAAETAATAMTQFNLTGEAVPHIADLLAAGANKAQGGVQELGYALKQSGLVASQMGLSVDETVGTLTAFASAGLLGSDAGTSFRTMLLSLANPSAKSAELMDELGINAYDATGKFVGMEKVAGQLTTAFQGKTQAERDSALATIFGSDAIRAASVLYAQGSDGVRQWTEDVNDSGAAARIAGELQNNLSGDVEKLGGSLDSLFILMGSGANGPLRELVQGITEVSDWFGSLPAPVQQTALVLGLAAGGVLLLSGAMLVAIPKALEYRAAITTLNQQVPQLGKNLRGAAAIIGGPWGAALAGSLIVIGMVIDDQRRFSEGTREIADSLDAATGEITKNTRATVAKQLADAGAYEAARKAGVSTKELTDAVLEGGGAWETTQGKIRDYYNTAGLFDITGSNQRDSLNRIAAQVAASSDEWERNRQATADAAEATGEAGSASDATADLMAVSNEITSDTAESMKELVDATRAYNGLNMSASEAAIGYQESLAGVDQRIRDIAEGIEGANNGLNEQGTGFDRSSEAGRENESMLLDLAKAGQDAADANQAAGGSAEDYRNELIASRDAWIEQATRFGLSREAATALADQIYRIPTRRETTLKVYSEEAFAAADRVYRKIMDIPGYKESVINTVVKQTGADRGQVGAAYNANGSVRMFAGGTENHVAQIARAGEWRVWAEDETGGEAYIPLAEAKRPRSTAILADVAERFGYALVPAGATRYADGSSGVGAPATVPGVANYWAGAQIGASADDVIRRQEANQKRAAMRASIRRVNVK